MAFGKAPKKFGLQVSMTPGYLALMQEIAELRGSSSMSEVAREYLLVGLRDHAQDEINLLKGRSHLIGKHVEGRPSTNEQLTY